MIQPRVGRKRGSCGVDGGGGDDPRGAGGELASFCTLAPFCTSSRVVVTAMGSRSPRTKTSAQLPCDWGQTLCLGCDGTVTAVPKSLLLGGARSSGSVSDTTSADASRRIPAGG